MRKENGFSKSKRNPYAEQLKQHKLPYNCVVVDPVELSKRARKQTKKLPRHIIENLAAWTDDVETRDEEVKKIPGYYDKPLYGDRRGQRSIRLSRAYRAITL